MSAIKRLAASAVAMATVGSVAAGAAAPVQASPVRDTTPWTWAGSDRVHDGRTEIAVHHKGWKSVACVYHYRTPRPMWISIWGARRNGSVGFIRDHRKPRAVLDGRNAYHMYWTSGNGHCFQLGPGSVEFRIEYRLDQGAIDGRGAKTYAAHIREW